MWFLLKKKTIFFSYTDIKYYMYEVPRNIHRRGWGEKLINSVLRALLSLLQGRPYRAIKKSFQSGMSNRIISCYVMLCSVVKIYQGLRVNFCYRLPWKWSGMVFRNHRKFSVDKKNQLDVTFCILYFSSNSCSTCFGQPCTHHQELTTAWCYSLVLVCAVAAGRLSRPVGR